jgi:hypothetical protein
MSSSSPNSKGEGYSAIAKPVPTALQRVSSEFGEFGDESLWVGLCRAVALPMRLTPAIIIGSFLMASH